MKKLIQKIKKSDFVTTMPENWVPHLMLLAGCIVGIWIYGGASFKAFSSLLSPPVPPFPEDGVVLIQIFRAVLGIGTGIIALMFCLWFNKYLPPMPNGIRLIISYKKSQR